jgi:micrococcal nuclease
MLRPVEIAEKLLRLVQHKHTHDRRTPSPPAGHNHGDVSSKNVTIRRHHLRLPWVIAVVGWGVLVVAGCGRSRSVDPQSLRRGDQVEVSVVGVHDGDTLTGLTVDHHQVKVRLEGIDAPELGQPFGKAAKRALSEKAFGNGAKIIVASHDQYGRVVGHVTVNGRDVGKDLVREGFAWCDPRFNHDKTLVADEQAARRTKAGLWAEKSPTPPWEYRKHRERKVEPTEPAASGRGWSWFRWW